MKSLQKFKFTKNYEIKQWCGWWCCDDKNGGEGDGVVDICVHGGKRIVVWLILSCLRGFEVLIGGKRLMENEDSKSLL